MSSSKEPQPGPSKEPRQVRDLLAALEKAQSRGQTKTTISSAASTSASAKKEKEKPTQAKKENQKKATAKPQKTGLSVGARMSAKSQRDAINSEPPKRSRQYSSSGAQPRPGPSQHGASSSTAGSGVPPYARLPEDVLDEICFRFLINLPENEKTETRICFQIEQAHWFYIDHYCKGENQRDDCFNVSMRDFLKQVFEHCDFLRGWANRADEVLENWRRYKFSVPTYGAVLLDESLNHVLLVQGYYASKNNWGFPKGKMNENEDPRHCAMREVLEETGYDIGETGTEPRLQKFVGETMVCLFLVSNVPADFPFAPKTRNEIRKIQWFSVWDLPTDRHDQTARAVQGISHNNFYTVIPFVSDLQTWVRKQHNKRKTAAKAPDNTRGRIQSHKSSSAFTPVVPKTPMEKLTSSLPSARVSEPRNLNELSAPSDPTATLFRPVGAASPQTFSGHTFLQMFSAGPGPSAPAPAQIVHPVPFPALPLLDEPVYQAPKEEHRTKRISTSDHYQKTFSDSNFVADEMSAAEIEEQLLGLLGATTNLSVTEESWQSPVYGEPSSLAAPLHFPLVETRTAPVFGSSSMMGSPLSTGTAALFSPFGSSTHVARSRVTSRVVSPVTLRQPQIPLAESWKTFKLDTTSLFPPRQQRPVFT